MIGVTTERLIVQIKEHWRQAKEKQVNDIPAPEKRLGFNIRYENGSQNSLLG